MNVRLGCKRDAAKAVRGELDRLDSGSTRQAYVDRRHNLVYKVGIYSDQDNMAEARDYERVRSEPAGRHVSPTTSWKVAGRVVNCQPLIPTLAHEIRGCDDWENLNAIIYDAVEELGIAGDTHDWNWGIDAEGVPVIFDWA